MTEAQTTQPNFALPTRTEGFLQHPNHYDFQSSKIHQFKTNKIDPVIFNQWRKENMYRTSYVSHYSEKPAEPKNTAIPRYQGYMPYEVPENIHAKRFSAVAREAYSMEKLGKNPHALSSTGFNYDPKCGIDNSLNASSSKYGKTAIQMSHTAWRPDKLNSTTHASFKDPRILLNPTYKPTDKFLQTEKAFTKVSGFSQNHSYLDGHGWNPHPVLNGLHDKTEYRDRFNKDETPFHRSTVLQKSRTLPKSENNYKYNR